MMRVRIEPMEFPQGRGYDVTIIDPAATVQDYLDALNEFILAAKGLRRERSVDAATECEGCPTCCMERVPLTSVDFYQYGHADVVEFVRDYCYVAAQGPVVDIMIAAQGHNLCQWLDTSTNKCSIYLRRSFVCQTYICCPISERGKLLRSIIVNSGEDELVRLWLTESFQRRIPVTFDEVEDLQVDLKDWQPNAFTGKRSYAQIQLRQLLSDEEWKLLTKENGIDE